VIARVEEAREVVIFAHTNAAVQNLASLAGKSIVFPDADLAMTTWAKAHLARAGLRAADFQSCLTIEDQGNETGHLVISSVETINAVLRKEADAGVGYRAQFERNKYWGLTMLDHFPETPNVLAAGPRFPADRIQALHRAIVALRTKATFNTLTIHGTGPMSPVTNAEFDPLRRAMQAAREFDGTVTPGK
jgi:ABC-type phosphate/phosphonate transport system substrate-binding protein